MLLKPKDKKAVSLIISYVLLISIGLAISGLVYGWLRFYVDVSEPEGCPEGVSLMIMDHSYEQTAPSGGNVSLNLTIENRGRFDIDGLVIRVNNRTDSTIGVYTVYNSDIRDFYNLDINFPIVPQNRTEVVLNSSYLKDHIKNRICFVDIQPIVKNDYNDSIYCTQATTRRIECS